MIKTYKSIVILLIINLLFSYQAIAAGDQPQKKEAEMTSDIIMSYALEGAYNPYRYIYIEIANSGKATLKWYPYKEQAEKTKTMQLDEITLRNLINAYEGMRFFDKEIVDLNKDKIYITDVGTTTLFYRNKEGERKLRYGYVEDEDLNKLVREFWKIIKKHIDII